MFAVGVAGDEPDTRALIEPVALADDVADPEAVAEALDVADAVWSDEGVAALLSVPTGETVAGAVPLVNAVTVAVAHMVGVADDDAVDVLVADALAVALCV